MIRTLALLGILGGAGAFSVCDLCNESAATTGITTPAAASRAAAGMGHMSPPSAALKTIAFKVEGMTCGGCVIGVRTVLLQLPGVNKADVSYEQRRATVMYDDTKVTAEGMIAAIKTLGYTATVGSA